MSGQEVDISLSVRIGRITLKNPIIIASGTYGYGIDVQAPARVSRIGGFCTKGLSLLPRDGNPPPRIYETRCGLMNSIGLANVGVEAFVRDFLPGLRDAGITTIANIFGESVDEFCQIAEILSDCDGLTAIEVNISCPNVKKAGVVFGKDPKVASKLTSEVVRVSKLPVIVKLTPEAGDIVEVAFSVMDAGAVAVTAANTYRALAIDVNKARPVFSNIYGGISGPAIKPLTMAIVYELYSKLKIPIIASGGTFCAKDVIEYMMAGAAAVQVGTANLLDPEASFKILDDFERECRIRKVSAERLIGMAHVK